MSGFHHEALFYSDPQEFLEGTVGFVRAGIDKGEPVMVALPEPNAGRLKKALGGAADEVLWVDMLALGRNPACIIPAWREFVDAHGSGGSAVRGIGEPAWAGREDHECVECGRHESLLNLAFEDAETFRLLCPYDASKLPAAVLEEARRNHPWVTHHGKCGDYLAPHGRAGPFAGELPALGPAPHSLRFGARDLSAVRAFVAARAHAAGMEQLRVLDLVVAVSELAANTVLHGGGSGELRVWKHAGRLVCEVQDAGLIEDPLAGRVAPATAFESGRGLWLVNHLCDLVQIRSGSEGTTVRIHMELEDLDSAPGGEELAQELPAFLGARPADDLGTVVEPRFTRHVED